ncbi:hypothetical protein ACNRWW_05825 [Metabacillus sp. HB246100]|uniref:hypothetical protein n=1 Tax=Bacillus weihaiensis TaxID=1547283 RepID=UPI00235201D6|nr:hypothetical protein [Bacillus weihaiensis]
MNEKIMNVLSKAIIAALPRQKKKVYQFIVEIEDQLAQQCTTKEQFMTLLKEQSPHKQAANKFHMSFEHLMHFMHEIEDEINRKLDEKLKDYRWIEVTDVKANNRTQNKQKTYVVKF